MTSKEHCYIPIFLREIEQFFSTVQTCSLWLKLFRNMCLFLFLTIKPSFLDSTKPSKHLQEEKFRYLLLTFYVYAMKHRQQEWKCANFKWKNQSKALVG